MLQMPDYKWETTERAKQLIIELEAIKLNFELLVLSPKREENLRKTALLKSAVFSARIEGFPDTMSSPKLESQNLLRAYHFVNSHHNPKDITLPFIKQLHALTLESISDNAGKWRQEAWGIFNEFGFPVHIAPLHTEVPELMDNFIKFVNSMTGHTSIKAAVAQFVFEKIHPFADGNGRVGRLISASVLASSGYGFRGLAPFEEYIDAHRSEYYAALGPSHSVTDFVEFFLEAIVFQSKQILIKAHNSTTEELPEDDLPLRQREILEVIRDHPYFSFDALQRRFMSIKTSTLHYDLTQLIKFGFIKKNRRTRGATYLAK